MALQYCQVCGVLIPNAPPGVDATICERCFSTRRLIVPGEDEGSSGPKQAAAPERVQFTCPSCQSLLQLPPVKKRTKIKCPRCSVDFYMDESRKIDAGASPQGGPQSKLI